MGVNARWICHTCKTVCDADGARAILHTDIKFPEAKQFLDIAPKISNEFLAGHQWESVISTLRNFTKWLKRHEGHQLWITNDHAVDFADLHDHRGERVTGRVSSKTFGELADIQAQEDLKNSCPTCGQILPKEEN